MDCADTAGDASDPELEEDVNMHWNCEIHVCDLMLREVFVRDFPSVEDSDVFSADRASGIGILGAARPQCG